jgi:hypothetical protein
MKPLIVSLMILSVLFVGAWLAYRQRLRRPRRSHKREYRLEVMRHSAKDRAKWDAMFDQ